MLLIFLIMTCIVLVGMLKPFCWVRSYIKNSTIRFKRLLGPDLVSSSPIDISNSIVYVDSLESDSITYSDNATYFQNIAENICLC